MWSFLLTTLIVLVTLGGIARYAERRNVRAGDPVPAPLTLLPGDIEYESPSGNFRFYFPVTTSIVLSIVLTVLLRLLG